MRFGSGESFWDERYRSPHAVWSGEPNGCLVDETAGLAPGAALDAGCGEGADAIWLAERGWRVTAADISSVALERARSLAAAAGVAARIEWLHADLVNIAPPGSYDLVSAQFMQFPPAERSTFFRGLAAAVKPGGTLLVVGHHPSDLETTARRPPLPELFYAADDIARLLEPNEWDVLVRDARQRGAVDPAGGPVTVRDTVLRARRTLR